MYRATTPTHAFKLPFEANMLKEIRITYAQGDTIVLEKTEADCTLSGNTVSLMLTQEETLLFNAERVNIQMRVLTTDGVVMASNKKSVIVQDVLNEEVLK